MLGPPNRSIRDDKEGAVRVLVEWAKIERKSMRLPLTIPRGRSLAPTEVSRRKNCVS